MLLDILVNKQYFGLAGGGQRPTEEAPEPGKRTGKVNKPFDPIWNVCWVVYIDFSAVVPGVSQNRHCRDYLSADHRGRRQTSPRKYANRSHRTPTLTYDSLHSRRRMHSIPRSSSE